MGRFLVEVSRNIDSYHTRDEIMQVLDELEFLFESLDGDQQEACSQLMSTLESRLRRLD